MCGRKVAKLEHFPFASTSPFVIAGLDPAIHLLRKGGSLEEDGPASSSPGSSPGASSRTCWGAAVDQIRARHQPSNGASVRHRVQGCSPSPTRRSIKLTTSQTVRRSRASRRHPEERASISERASKDGGAGGDGRSGLSLFEARRAKGRAELLARPALGQGEKNCRNHSRPQHLDKRPLQRRG